MLMLFLATVLNYIDTTVYFNIFMKSIFFKILST